MAKPISMDLGIFDDYIKKNAGNRTLSEMYRELGVSRSAIERRASLLGISLQLKNPEKEAEIQRIVETIKKLGHTHTTRQLAEKLGVTFGRIFYYAHLHGLYIKKELETVCAESANDTTNRIFRVNARENWLI